MKQPDSTSSTRRSLRAFLHRARLLRAPLRPAVLALLLVVVLGIGVEGCLFLDVLTGLYTGTYVEFSACKLDEEGRSCETLNAAHDVCIDEKGVGHDECRARFKQAMDCAFCDFFFAEAYLSSSAASKHTTRAVSADDASLPVIFWSQGSTHVFRTVGGGTSVREIVDTGRWPLGIAVDAEAGTVYWTDGRTNSLRRAGLDGSNIEDLIPDLYGSGVALDAAGQMLYVGNAGDGTIERLNLSTLAHDVLVADAFSPVDLVFDPTSNTLYWTQNGLDGGSIQRLDTGGASEPETVAAGLTLPFGLALDSAAGLLYWSDLGDNTIQSIDLGNPVAVNDVLTNLDQPGALALDESGEMLYWADVGTAQLKRASLADPANTMQTLNGFTAVADLALDESSGHLYWTGWVSGMLLRSNLDGSAAQALIVPQSLGGDLALDPVRQKVYWMVQTTGRIQRANLDGTGIEDIDPIQLGVGAVAFDAVNDKLYWTAGGSVLRADPDGSNAETIVTGIVFIGDLEIDAQEGKLYWVNRESIQRSNLDGTGIETFYTDTNLVEHVAVHDGHVYWSVPFPDVIRRAALDGSTGVEDVVTGVNFVQQIAIAGDKLYWSLPLEGKVQRSNLDGTGVEDVLTNLDEPTGLALLTLPDGQVPVELASFDAVVEARDVLLTWTTASETNNAGFEIEAKRRVPQGIQRHAKDGEASWEVMAFVEGRGTTTEAQAYAFRMDNLAPGRHRFRLKQVDFDGTFAYSPEVEVTVELATAFELLPVYPNPFNPQARFTLSVAQPQHVQVAVYDLQGRLVQYLHDGRLEADRSYTFTLDGSRWASGVYFYEAAGERFRVRRSALLVK